MFSSPTVGALGTRWTPVSPYLWRQIQEAPLLCKSITASLGWLSTLKPEDCQHLSGRSSSLVMLLVCHADTQHTSAEQWTDNVCWTKSFERMPFWFFTKTTRETIFIAHTWEEQTRLSVSRFLGETAGWASARLLLSPSSHPFSRLALRKHGSQFENSSCLINDVYTGISVSSSSSWSVLFSCLLCSNPADRWFCHDKCKVCISHVTAGQPIITVHFPWLCKPL